MSGRLKSDFRRQGAAVQGFTLVELLLAIFIFAIVISAVYGSYRATFQITKGSEYQTEVAQQAGFVLERIAEDLGSLVLGKEGYLLGEEHEYSGARGDSLTFLANAHIALSKNAIPAGHAIIRYSVGQNDRSGLLTLYRSDTLPLPGVEFRTEEVSSNVFCEGLREVRFNYHDLRGNMVNEWRSTENTTGGGNLGENGRVFPVLVEVELHFAESATSEQTTVFKTAVALPWEEGK